MPAAPIAEPPVEVEIKATPEKGFLETMFGGGNIGIKPPEKTAIDLALEKQAAEEKAKPEPEPEKKEAPKAKEEPKVEPEPAAAPAKKVIRQVAKGYQQQPSAPVDAKEIAVETAKAVAKVMRDEARPKEVALDDEQQYTLTVLEQLEADSPQAKGIVERARTALTEIASTSDTFRAKWEARHPAGDFDSDAARDEAFTTAYDGEVERIEAKHKVTWDDRQFKQAEARLATKPIEEKAKRLEAEVERLSQRDREREVEPEIASFAANSQKALAADLIGKEVDVSKITEADPENGHIIQKYTDSARRFAEDCAKTFMGLAPDAVAIEIVKRCEAYSKAIMSLPADQRVDAEGRTFVPRGAYNKLTAEQREGAWTMDERVAVEMFNGRAARAAREEIATETARFEATLARRGLKPAEKTEVKTEAAKVSEAKTAKPSSPGTTVSPQTVPDKKAGSNGDGGFMTRLISGGTIDSRPPAYRKTT